MYNVVKALIFRIIQIVWLPIAIVGYILFISESLIFRRTPGVSYTTYASLYTRWMQHKLGTRRDVPCERLMMVHPSTPHLALHLITAGTLLGHRLTGYVPSIYRYPYEGDPPMMHESAARTTFFDAALAHHLKEIDQLVVLGAGFDTRSYRMPQEIHCFEIDAPKTQELKRRLLKKANLDTTRITFVPANFLTDDWLANLVNAGFDPNKRTFFLWEAVTPYLDREAVESTLRKIASTAKGSAVAFDYFHADLISSQSPYWRYIRAILNVIGEPFTFGFEATTPASKYMAEFLASCGLSMEEQRNFGPETARKPALMGFTTAVV